MKQLFDLQLFAEADSADNAATVGSADMAQAQDDAVQTGETADNHAEVQDAAEQDEPSEAPNFVEQISAMSDEDKITLYDDLLKNDQTLKNHYNNEFKTALNRRMSKVEQKAQEEIEQYDSFVKDLSSVYGADDLEGLKQKLLFDEKLLELQAYDSGMTVDQLKVQRELDIKARRIGLVQSEQEQQRLIDRQFEEWREMAGQVKKEYPDFDFDSEFKNDESGEDFYNLLESGVSMKTAYEIMHHNDILNKRVFEAVEKAKKETVDTIKARGTRPTENGNGSQAPSSSAVDVSNMTAEQIKDIALRVARGERITL